MITLAVSLTCLGAKVKEDSLHISNPAVTQLFSELDYLRGNHSDVIKAEEEAKKALESAINNHKEVKVKIEQLKTVNDGYEKQMGALRIEKTNLKSNISALGEKFLPEMTRNPLFLSENSCDKCAPGWILFNSSCYFFSSTESSAVKRNWHESRVDCVSRGSDLVVIDNQQEQVVNFLINHQDASQLSTDFWIGLSDSEEEGTWKWLDGTFLVQGYWNDGEPTNLNDEDCAALYPRVNFFKAWNDVRCGVRRKWICEKAPESMS
uniref:C-type lectin domain-containing protein n=1 Tax=Neolamprologus brichardi TaxID=32507 RepID=A0A3Q4GFI1_NEOBR